MFSKIGYALRQSFAQIGRNKGVNVAAVLAITAMMLILGISKTRARLMPSKP